MCGIVGYTGHENAKDIIIDGLKKLEYRGYDSAGIALNAGGRITVRKKAGAENVGAIKVLEKFIAGEKLYAETGIGHTRWATHGAPTDENAHPHLDESGDIAIVHNGIVENYMELKEQLMAQGIAFESETDTEVIAKYLGTVYRGDLEKAVMETVKVLKGAFTFVATSALEPDKIVAYRNNTPLVAGLGKNCNFLASDVTPLLRYLNEIFFINDDELVVCTPNAIKIYDKNHKRVRREPMTVTWSVEDAEKGGYQHFMLKEIHDQPKAVEETLSRRIGEDGKIKLDGIDLTLEDLNKINKIFIVACGTAYHAGLVGKILIEKFAGIPVETDIASEFRYRDPIVDDKTLFIAVSQSGETADTLQSLREAKNKGARILSIVNVVGSSVARESDDVFYTWAGPEIAVASTKAYTTQLICFYLLALYMGDLNGHIDKARYDAMINELRMLPEKIERALDLSDQIEGMAELLYNKPEMFFIGRGLDAAVAYEASLKQKEISYVNTFAIAAGELKHGTIALMEPSVCVVSLATQDALLDKIYSNIQEVKARHAHVISLVKQGRDKIREVSSEVIEIPDCADEVAPVLAIVPLQLFAYYVARYRGENIDKPRNLAKSVTVE